MNVELIFSFSVLFLFHSIFDLVWSSRFRLFVCFKRFFISLSLCSCFSPWHETFKAEGPPPFHSFPPFHWEEIEYRPRVHSLLPPPPRPLLMRLLLTGSLLMLFMLTWHFVAFFMLFLFHNWSVYCRRFGLFVCLKTFFICLSFCTCFYPNSRLFRLTGGCV